MTYTNSDKLGYTDSCESKFTNSFTSVLRDKLKRNGLFNNCEIVYINWFLWELWTNIEKWVVKSNEIEFYKTILDSILKNSSIDQSTLEKTKSLYDKLNNIKK